MQNFGTNNLTVLDVMEDNIRNHVPHILEILFAGQDNFFT